MSEKSRPNEKRASCLRRRGPVRRGLDKAMHFKAYDMEIQAFQKRRNAYEQRMSYGGGLDNGADFKA